VKIHCCAAFRRDSLPLKTEANAWCYKLTSRSKSLTLNTPPVIDPKAHIGEIAIFVPVRGSPSEHCNNVWFGKQEWWVYRWWKKSEKMFTCFDTIYEHDGRTDRHHTMAKAMLAALLGCCSHEAKIGRHIFVRGKGAQNCISRRYTTQRNLKAKCSTISM